MTAIVFRALSFLKPEAARTFVAKKSMAKSQQPEDWLHVQPKQLPQTLPDWVKDSSTFQHAVEAGYLMEVALAEPSITKAKPAHRTRQSVGNMQDEYFPPLAAETRDPKTMGYRSGIPAELI